MGPRLWEVALGLPLHDFAIDANSHYLAFTPDGRQLLTVPDDFRKAAFQIWDVKSGRDVRKLTLADNKEFIPNRNNCGEVRVTPDGHRVLALTLKNGKTRNESILTVWDLATGQCLRHERVPWDESSILTPEGTGVVMLDSQTGEVKLRELEKGRPRQSFAPDWILNPQGPSNLALSPDNRHVAVGFQTKVTEQGVLRLGDLTTGQMFTLPVKGPASAFSPDARLLAAAVADGIGLFEVASGQSVGLLRTIEPSAVVAGACARRSPSRRTAGSWPVDMPIAPSCSGTPHSGPGSPVGR